MTEEIVYDVVISRSARTDLETIGDYLRERFSWERAAEFIAATTARIDRLEHFPFRGSVPPEAEGFGPTNYRQIVSGPNRLIYKVEDRRVTVVLIADGRRDMTSLLRDRLMKRE